MKSNNLLYKPILFLLLSFLCVFISFFFEYTPVSFFFLFSAQLLLFLPYFFSGNITGSGAFLLMSVLFYGVRPLYIVVENDTLLLNRLFLVSPSIDYLYKTSIYCFLLSVFFFVGCFFAARNSSFDLAKPNRYLARLNIKINDYTKPILLVLSQLACYAILYTISGGGRSLYSSAGGAFVYELPIPLQAVNVFSSIYILERFLARKSYFLLYTCIISFSILFAFTWQMRAISIFRGFWIFGLIILFLSFILTFRKRVGFTPLLIPLILLQPLFQYLGEARELSNAELASAFSLNFDYWTVYESAGDFNIYDTFVAATLSTPSTQPFLLSWLYPIVHIIPRSLWPGKPLSGILQDVSFTNGAPYSPGIAGFFWLDGGYLWALICMFVLGFLIYKFDLFCYSFKSFVVKSLFISLFVVNALFLTRTFLWFFFWQTMYSFVPVYILGSMFLNDKTIKSKI